MFYTYFFACSCFLFFNIGIFTSINSFIYGISNIFSWIIRICKNNDTSCLFRNTNLLYDFFINTDTMRLNRITIHITL